MDCLVSGCNFLLRRIPDEVFTYQKHPEPGSSQYRFQPALPDVFPYLLVNIGSGVSILKVKPSIHPPYVSTSVPQYHTISVRQYLSIVPQYVSTPVSQY